MAPLGDVLMEAGKRLGYFLYPTRNDARYMENAGDIPGNVVEGILGSVRAGLCLFRFY